jgi:GNAT superfamily N-acetyltransferase
LELVRWTDPGHLPSSLQALISEAVHGGHEWVSNLEEAWLQRPFIDPGEALFFTFKNVQVVAMAAISADPFVSDPAVGRLRFVYVREIARRRGIGERLLDECLALAKGHWQTLRLHTSNEVAARMYERRGFLPISGDPRVTHIMPTVL